MDPRQCPGVSPGCLVGLLQPPRGSKLENRNRTEGWEGGERDKDRDRQAFLRRETQRVERCRGKERQTQRDTETDAEGQSLVERAAEGETDRHRHSQNDKEQRDTDIHRDRHRETGRQTDRAGRRRKQKEGQPETGAGRGRGQWTVLGQRPSPGRLEPTSPARGTSLTAGDVGDPSSLLRSGPRPHLKPEEGKLRDPVP